eukprot:SAG11_NODE_4581_length_1844_cov_1.598281_4_plen_67_part_01
MRYTEDDELEGGVGLERLRPRLPECAAGSWQPSTALARCAAHRCGDTCTAVCKAGYLPAEAAYTCHA